MKFLKKFTVEERAKIFLNYRIVNHSSDNVLDYVNETFTKYLEDHEYVTDDVTCIPQNKMTHAGNFYYKALYSIKALLHYSKKKAKTLGRSIIDFCLCLKPYLTR